MYVDGQTVITAAAVIAAVVAIAGYFIKIYKFVLKQEEQDKRITALEAKHDRDISATDEELSVICYALLACLDGLTQLGANHNVPEVRDKLEKHLNQKAHKNFGG